MKITIEVYDEKYSVEMNNDADFNAFMERFRNLLRAFYSQDKIEEYFK